jgi:hypothetical protein
MSGSIAATRALDDRRRRLLAVGGDGASDTEDAGALSVLRERQLDLPAAAPWLPRARWKFWLILSSFWLGVIAAAVLIIQPMTPHPQIEPAVRHLVDGPRCVLATYCDILLWTLAAQMAALVGWYRSHSQLDFRGRYRLWSWAVVVFAAWGFCAGTGIHTAIGQAAGPHLRWPIWRAETVVWLAPAMLAGLSAWWVIRHDLTRCRVSHTLVHLAACALLLTGAGLLYQPELSLRAWGPGALVGLHFAGMGLLVTGLWWQAWFVTYVCADPPDPTQPVNWRGKALAIAGLLWSCLVWPFRRRAADTATPSKRKAEDDDGAPKRRRKTTAKSKRTTRSRAKAKSEDTAEDEDASTEEDESSSDESWSDDEDAAPARPAPMLAKSVSSMSSRPSAPTPSKPTASQAPTNSSWSDDDEDSDSDDDDTHYRVDGAHGGADPFKGLSKRQRRELKRQMREQQRQQLRER